MTPHNDVDHLHYWHDDYMREKHLRVKDVSLRSNVFCKCGHPEDEHDIEEWTVAGCAWKFCKCKYFKERE